MKKIMTLATFALISAVGVNAQTLYDAAKIANKDLSGTARFVGMGGAMGALGGDISTIGTNPAGIGIYRSNDIMTTFNFATMETKSKYDGVSGNTEADKFLFNNIGVVFSSKIGNNTNLRYVNFGFNYSRSKSFYKNMSMEGLLKFNSKKDYVSPAYYMERQANNTTADLYQTAAFRDNNVGWLSVLAAQTNVLMYDEKEDFFYVEFPDGAEPYMSFMSDEKGGIDQYDFNVSFNFNDRFYLGATIGAYDVNYRKHSYYDENYGDGQGYGLDSWNRIDGSGFDFKLGAIVRPFEESPLRIGLSFHTPVFYKLTYSTSALMASDFYYDDDTTTTRYEVDTRNVLKGDGTRDFKLRTPWTINASLGYTIGNEIALGFEYEYEDYSTMKFRDPAGYNMDVETGFVNDMMKGVNTFRLGAEYKPVPEFALRAGYNYSTAIFKDNAYKILPYNSINTDMDYANSKGISNYTLGIGYKGDYFYADVAYKFNTYKENFFAFYDSEDTWTAADYLNPTKVTNNTHQVYVTLGLRF